MPFVRYTHPSRKNGPPGITIYANGMIGFNAATFALCRLSEYDYCVLYFDADTRRIGFTFGSDATEEGVRKLAVVGGMKQVRGTGFLHEFGIPIPEKATRYAAQLEDEMLVVSVGERQE